MTMWSLNMSLDGSMSLGIPADPSKPGKVILIFNEASRTTIRAFSSHPGT
jgi:hypothetical protein